MSKHRGASFLTSTGDRFPSSLNSLNINTINTNEGTSCAVRRSQYVSLLSAVPETLDRKHFHQAGMCVHTSSVKGPPQVCAETYRTVPCGGSHGNGVIVWCVFKVGPKPNHYSPKSKGGCFHIILMFMSVTVITALSEGEDQ